MTTTISTTAGRREQKPRMNQSEEQGRSSKTTKERPMEADAWATKDSSDTRGGNSFEGGNHGEKGMVGRK